MSKKIFECNLEVEALVTLKLNTEDAETLLDIFEFYLLSCSVQEGNQGRVHYDGSDMSGEYKFIKKYFELAIPFHGANWTLERIKTRRKTHIDWLIDGQPDAGVCGPTFNLPNDHEEMRQFLYQYDMDWLGENETGTGLDFSRETECNDEN